MYNIRNAVEKDLDALAGMEVEIAVISFREEAIDNPAFHKKRLSEAFRRDPSGMFVVTFKAADNSSEAICGWLWMDRRTNSLTQEVYINFRSFYIGSAIRGSEWADRLMEKGLAYANGTGARTVTGKVNVDNLPMRAIYKKFGFAATHVSMELHLPEGETGH